jgi:TolB-like protein/Tfp pilus assembly protein PilF
MSRLLAFLRELRRRRVYHVAAVYGAAAFVAAQGAEIFLPRLGLPDWTVTLVVVLAVAGFPVALILGWTFDLTPEGVRRTGEAREGEAPLRPGRWRLLGGTAAAVAVLVGGGWWLSARAFDRSPAPPIHRLAVLPLANLMNDPEEEYFVQGMHDALISELHQAGLEVIARTSVMGYRDTDRPVRLIARELGVGAVIEGSVLREGDRVRIRVQLVHGATESHLWGRTYDAQLRDVLGLHRRITWEVAEEIRASLSPGAERRLAADEPVNAEAYEAWLRGRFHKDRWTPRDSEIALQYFERALERDPRYAPAHVGIAEVWHFRRQAGMVPAREAGPHVKAAAMRALELDPALAPAWMIRGMDATWGDWDWVAAEEAFRRAVELSPGFAQVRAPFSHFLFVMGREEEALAQIERALALDPFNPFIKSIYGIDLIFARRYDEAIRQLLGTLALDPEHGLARHHLKRAYALSGMHAEAFEAIRRAMPPVGGHAEGLEAAFAEGGYPAALRILADARADAARADGAAANLAGWEVARLYAQIGDLDEAFRWLEEAFERRDPNLPYVAVDPDFDNLRGDPRFAGLLRRMNLAH